MAQEKGQSFPSKEKLPTQKSWEKGTRCLEELGVGEWVGERRLEGLQKAGGLKSRGQERMGCGGSRGPIVLMALSGRGGTCSLTRCWGREERVGDRCTDALGKRPS